MPDTEMSEQAVLKGIEHLVAQWRQGEAEKLKEALQNGPLPLVWGFRRSRRARALPPAYVVMFHCEQRATFDASYLSKSLWATPMGAFGGGRPALRIAFTA